ncbi:MAG: 4-(cytidine 5'-diphospho)-2-C-methyl-D-erythritol kinase [Steroidobacteraceae bacterium]|jgi:4-diphosphocytidyl-2-C-methyl-D-erythritol kinase
MSDRPWPAPAKLNLFLHILGKRPDGYHDLQTCFQFIDLCDELRIVVRVDGKIQRRSGAAGVAADADLSVRAALALQKAASSPLGADIDVLKRIPMGAGLGGGSSDAATTLVALNRLWGLDWAVDRLAELGLGLGADVPVFVRGRAAWGEGIGERLTPLYPPLAPIEHNYLIIKPNVSISTAAVFADPELTRNTPPITIAGFFAAGGRNDCEPVVRRRYPAVGMALDWLSRYGAARLTGTGACVFVACETSARGREILNEMPPAFDGFLARGLNDSPLLERLATG